MLLVVIFSVTVILSLLSFVNHSRCKDTKVERNGKIYFVIPEMKYLRERSESKIRKNI